MTITDQAEFVISYAGIHGRLAAWKLAPKEITRRAPVRMFSIRCASRYFTPSNTSAAPALGADDLEPNSLDRFAFGDLAPVLNGPGGAG